MLGSVATHTHANVCMKKRLSAGSTCRIFFGGSMKKGIRSAGEQSKETNSCVIENEGSTL